MNQNPIRSVNCAHSNGSTGRGVLKHNDTLIRMCPACYTRYRVTIEAIRRAHLVRLAELRRRWRSL